MLSVEMTSLSFPVHYSHCYLVWPVCTLNREVFSFFFFAHHYFLSVSASLVCLPFFPHRHIWHGAYLEPAREKVTSLRSVHFLCVLSLSARPVWGKPRRRTGLLRCHFELMRLRCGQLVWASELSACLEQPAQWNNNNNTQHQQFDQVNLITPARNSCQLLAHMSHTFPLSPTYLYFLRKRFLLQVLLPAGIIITQSADILVWFYVLEVLHTVIIYAYKALHVCLKQSCSWF